MISGSRCRRVHETRARSRGFTLYETMAALTAVSLLAGSLAACVLVSLRAVSVNVSTDAAARAIHTVQQLMDEVSFARTITSRSASSITYTRYNREEQPTSLNQKLASTMELLVPLTESNSQTSRPVTLRWSGIDRDPLLLIANGSTKTLLTDVREFSLSYQIDQDSRPDPGATATPASGADALVVSQTPSASSEFPVSNVKWVSLLFTPTLPEGAVGWVPTSVRLRMRRTSALTTPLLVELRRPAVSETPSLLGFSRRYQETVPSMAAADLLAQESFPQSNLPTTANWHTITFTNPPTLDPATPYCLVLRMSQATEAYVSYTSSNPSAPPTLWLAQWNEPLATWALWPKYRLVVEMTGRPVLAPTATPTITESRLARIGVRVRTGDAPAIETTLPMFNHPVVSP